MKKSKYLLVISIFVISAFARPPYMWYATYSVNSYQETCAGIIDDCDYSHMEANGFSQTIQTYASQGLINNLWWRYQRQDPQCDASQWVVPGDGDGAEINGVDFAVYCGHGCQWGPVLSCQPSGMPKSRGMWLHGWGYLKWLLFNACAALEDNPVDGDVFYRWNVRQSDGQSAFQGIHCIMGNRGIYWSSGYNIGGVFLQQWVEVQKSLFDAYFWASYFAFYHGWCVGTTQPAVLSSSHQISGAGYYAEFYEDATDDPAPTGATSLVWTSYSQP
jgi:hypothetical protein